MGFKVKSNLKVITRKERWLTEWPNKQLSTMAYFVQMKLVVLIKPPVYAQHHTMESENMQKERKGLKGDHLQIESHVSSRK